MALGRELSDFVSAFSTGWNLVSDAQDQKARRDEEAWAKDPTNPDNLLRAAQTDHARASADRLRNPYESPLDAANARVRNAEADALEYAAGEPGRIADFGRGIYGGTAPTAPAPAGGGIGAVPVPPSGGDTSTTAPPPMTAIPPTGTAPAVDTGTPAPPPLTPVASRGGGTFDPAAYGYTTEGLNSGMATGLQAFLSDAPDGVRVISDYRSEEEQRVIYDRKYRQAQQAHPGWDDAQIRNSLRGVVATPGNSNHQRGTAVDLQFTSPEAEQWARENAQRYGMAFPLPDSDPNHMEFRGGSGGGGGTAIAYAPTPPSALATPAAGAVNAMGSGITIPTAPGAVGPISPSAPTGSPVTPFEHPDVPYTRPSEATTVAAMQMRDPSRTLGPQPGQTPNPAWGETGTDGTDYTLAAAHDAVRDGATRAMAETGFAPTGVPTPEAQGAGEAYVRGAGAAPASLMEQLYGVVDPNGEMPLSERNLRAIGIPYQYYMSRGEPEKAQAAAAQVLQYYRMAFNNYKALAQVALEDGNLTEASKLIVQAYAHVPDGNNLDVVALEDGTFAFSYTDLETGETKQEGIMTPQELGAAAMGISSVGFDEFLLQAAGERASAGSTQSAAFTTGMNTLRAGGDFATIDTTGMTNDELTQLRMYAEAYGKSGGGGDSVSATDYQNIEESLGIALAAPVEGEPGGSTQQVAIQEVYGEKYGAAHDAITDVARQLVHSGEFDVNTAVEIAEDMSIIVVDPKTGVIDTNPSYTAEIGERGVEVTTTFGETFTLPLRVFANLHDVRQQRVDEMLAEFDASMRASEEGRRRGEALSEAGDDFGESLGGPSARFGAGDPVDNPANTELQRLNYDSPAPTRGGSGTITNPLPTIGGAITGAAAAAGAGLAEDAASFGEVATDTAARYPGYNPRENPANTELSYSDRHDGDIGGPSAGAPSPTSQSNGDVARGIPAAPARPRFDSTSSGQPITRPPGPNNGFIPQSNQQFPRRSALPIRGVGAAQQDTGSDPEATQPGVDRGVTGTNARTPTNTSPQRPYTVSDPSQIESIPPGNYFKMSDQPDIFFKDRDGTVFVLNQVSYSDRGGMMPGK